MRELLARVNWVDIFVVILLIRGTYVGTKIGFVWGFFRVFGITIVALLALQNYGYLAEVISFYTPLPITLAEFVSFVLIVVVGLLVFMAARFLLQKILKIEFTKAIEKPGGIVMSFIYSCILVSLILINLVLLSVPYLTKSITERSLLGGPFLKIAPQMYTTIMNYYPDIEKADVSHITGPGESPDKKK